MEILSGQVENPMDSTTFFIYTEEGETTDTFNNLINMFYQSAQENGDLDLVDVMDRLLLELDNEIGDERFEIRQRQERIPPASVRTQFTLRDIPDEEIAEGGEVVFTGHSSTSAQRISSRI
jgi:hypothetical protein